MGGPLTPALTPQNYEDDADIVPFYYLDDPAGIEDYYCDMGNTFSTLPSLISASTEKRVQATLTSVLRKPSKEPSSPAPASPEATKPSRRRLRKLVRFLDRVEIFPAPLAFYMAPEDQPSGSPAKKQKLSPNPPRCSFYGGDDSALELDAGIASGLGWAGSPNRSPSRSPNTSTADVTANNNDNNNNSSNSSNTNTTTHERVSGYLTPPRTEAHSSPHSSPSPPPSWRIPPESLVGRQPTVRTPPRVRSPSRADEEIDLRANEHEDEDGAVDSMDEEVAYVRPGVSIIRRVAATTPPKAVTHPVIARKMWPHGEVRFEDQWGRRLIPTEHRDSFQFDLWPVEEDVDREGDGRSVRGAWVKGGRYRDRLGERLFERR